jgi:drug/metabolite transporter (DMT)-like permease
MKRQNLVMMLSLGAIWGGSYVFMRLGAGEFGAITLAGLRATGAALVMLPVLLLMRQHRTLLKHWKPIAMVGIINSAFPFVLFNYAALHINAGLSSVLSAAAPLFAGLIAYLWLRERLPALRWLGLMIGFMGVLGLWEPASWRHRSTGWRSVSPRNISPVYHRWRSPLAVKSRLQLCSCLYLYGCGLSERLPQRPGQV